MKAGAVIITGDGSLGSPTRPVIVYAVNSNDPGGETLTVRETDTDGVIVLRLSSSIDAYTWNFGVNGILFPLGVSFESENAGTKLTVVYKLV